jgi:hypothetical protein
MHGAARSKMIEGEMLMTPKHLTAAAAALAAFSAALPARAVQISFSGYQWTVKDSAGSDVGPGPNSFDAQNVSVDGDGCLHLRIVERNGVWTCSEVIADISPGYGTYRVTYKTRVDDLDANVVLAMFTWSDASADAHREIDVELSRWGDPSNDNAQWVVQPYTTRGRIHRWNLVLSDDEPGSIHTFRWLVGSVRFESHKLDGTRLTPPWTHASRTVPKHGDENPRLNLWLYGGAAPTDGQPVEVVVTKFEYLP